MEVVVTVVLDDDKRVPATYRVAHPADAAIEVKGFVRDIGNLGLIAGEVYYPPHRIHHIEIHSH